MVKILSPTTETLEKPAPRSLAGSGQAGAGPSLGQLFKRPLSPEILSRLAPRNVGQSVPLAFTKATFCASTGVDDEQPIITMRVPPTASQRFMEILLHRKCAAMNYRLEMRASQGDENEWG